MKTYLLKKVTIRAVPLENIIELTPLVIILCLFAYSLGKSKR